MVQTTKWAGSTISDLRLNEQTMFWGTTDPTSGLPTNSWFFNTSEKKIKQNTGTEGAPTWTTRFDAVSSFSLTKGNILVSNGTTWIPLGVGTNTDVLTADSGEASGVKWAPPLGGWEEVARTTLTSVADVITVSSIPNRKYYSIYLFEKNDANSTVGQIKFNNDSSALYITRYSDNNGAEVLVTANTKVDIGATTGTDGSLFGIIEINNISGLPHSAIFKITQTRLQVSIVRREGTFMYNSTTVLSRIDWNNTGAGSFAIGSEIIVFGRD